MKHFLVKCCIFHYSIFNEGEYSIAGWTICIKMCRLTLKMTCFSTSLNKILTDFYRMHLPPVKKAGEKQKTT